MPACSSPITPPVSPAPVTVPLNERLLAVVPLKAPITPPPKLLLCFIVAPVTVTLLTTPLE